uniref:Uncharacterized protein n=1 Tax=Rangifer tarandus platyrhynchus TaxID=3082113 RepID=A0ACB0FEQ4_RANTA|nr:unnamed protein product [Rangifer tarandus platyrhynchus]
MKTWRSSWGIRGWESSSLREGLVRPALCRVGGCVCAMPSTLRPSPSCPLQPDAGPEVPQPKQSLDQERGEGKTRSLEASGSEAPCLLFPSVL